MTDTATPTKLAATPTDREAALNTALAKAQGEFPTIKRDKVVTTGSYSFAYAPLDAILEAVRPVLAKHKLSVTQQLATDLNDRPSLRTELRHADGGVIAATFPLLAKPESPQQLGSLLTYYRRYAIVAMLGLATEEDDDGHHAANPNEPATFAAPKLKPDADERERDRRKIWAIATKLDKTGRPEYSLDVFKMGLGQNYETEDPGELTPDQAKQVIAWLTREQNKLIEQGELQPWEPKR